MIAVIVIALIFLPLLIIVLQYPYWQETNNATKHAQEILGADVRRGFYLKKADFEKLRTTILSDPNVNSFGPHYVGSYFYSPKTIRAHVKGWFARPSLRRRRAGFGYSEQNDPVPESEVFRNLTMTPKDYDFCCQLMSQDRILSVEKSWALNEDLGKLDCQPRPLPAESKISGKSPLKYDYKTKLSNTQENEICVSFEIFDPSYVYQPQGLGHFVFYIDYLPLGDRKYSRLGFCSTFEQLDGSWFLEKHFLMQRTSNLDGRGYQLNNKLFK